MGGSTCCCFPVSLPPGWWPCSAGTGCCVLLFRRSWCCRERIKLTDPHGQPSLGISLHPRGEQMPCVLLSGCWSRLGGNNIWQLEAMPGEPLCCPSCEGKSPLGIPGPTAGGGVGDLGWVKEWVGGTRGDVGRALWVSVTVWCTWLCLGCAHRAAEALSRVENLGFRANVWDVAPGTDKWWQIPNSSKQGRKSKLNTPGAMWIPPDPGRTCSDAMDSSFGLYREQGGVHSTDPTVAVPWLGTSLQAAPRTYMIRTQRQKPVQPPALLCLLLCAAGAAPVGFSSLLWDMGTLRFLLCRNCADLPQSPGVCCGFAGSE